ncbi:MAG: magnesium/cobalt transporter CorA [Oscillochloridaceae bacterium]|nr:magnesium/cobalt transporter CorA [Chloroflexaceae bacterium]MDW8389645.1 magnesium/cobalt transporter CorA [Oscillochloridaceae bacterium]
MNQLQVCQAGDFCAVTDLDAISQHLETPETVVWLDLESPGKDEIALLQREFNFHPLAIEDAVRDHERPKIERHTDYYLLIFYAASYNGANGGLAATSGASGPNDATREPQIDLRQLSIFVGKNFIVTIRRQPIPQVAETMARWRMPTMPLGNSISSILYGLLDAIVDDYFTLMDQIAEWVDELEDLIFSRERQDAIKEIFGLKKDLLLLRRVVAPERDVLNILLRQEVPIVQPGELVYLQDVYDHLVRVTDSIDLYRELLTSAYDSYLSIQSNQLNQLVKTLTLASIILMSASLIAGIYGMNFENMPELAWRWGYPMALGMMLGVGTSLALFFRSRNWW